LNGHTIKVWANYYQQFDADFSREVPGEGYGGWKRAEIEVAPAHTAVVVMHAWNPFTREEYPGWYRAVEYLPRSKRICQEVFPALLEAVRNSPIRLFHVQSDGPFLRQYPGYAKTVELAGPEPPAPAGADSDPVLKKLGQFRGEQVFPGKGNAEDCSRAFKVIDFAPEARPVGDEPVAVTSHQLAALCRHHDVNHLVYAGFAIDWCLLMSPGGMLDMSRRGIMCSAIRQATTAVENKRTAREELCKEIGLWRVSVAFGFVFDVDDFLGALATMQKGA
jgi:nicotinamidase-related amidase